MNCSVETIPNFDRELKKLAKKYPSLKKEVIELGNLLTDEPAKGAAIGKNCYKIRLSIKSKGKASRVVPKPSPASLPWMSGFYSCPSTTSQSKPTSRTNCSLNC